MKTRVSRTKCKLKQRIVCKKCFIAFENKSKKILTQCPNCKRNIDARIRTEESKVYNRKNKHRIEAYKKYNKENSKTRGQKSRERLRRTILNIVSNNNPVCVRCGCDDIRFLEINHKNGGGNKEMANGKKSNNFYWDIYMGRRNTDDLELLCKPCNSIHALELKYGNINLRTICIK